MGIQDHRRITMKMRVFFPLAIAAVVLLLGAYADENSDLVLSLDDAQVTGRRGSSSSTGKFSKGSSNRAGNCEEDLDLGESSDAVKSCKKHVKKAHKATKKAMKSAKKVVKATKKAVTKSGRRGSSKSSSSFSMKSGSNTRGGNQEELALV